MSACVEWVRVQISHPCLSRPERGLIDWEIAFPVPCRVFSGVQTESRRTGDSLEPRGPLCLRFLPRQPENPVLQRTSLRAWAIGMATLCAAQTQNSAAARGPASEVR